ncbi:NitT/TauT family transport system substrate-binding protein [Stella humosa]|uniref:NitT/TauT family transport system substrate-binding protein n=1 Tax=Stella humosa TaxID=94 RepID=A0A3N1KZV4_9PROT|nr:ABC transporter substrate-binding protein [Stella humosa]ROP84190.1 NitT/TauT family transport system substrate-binding protein [Stella humosa]BBK33702.1 nitrate ABC transporter substrate-binding protein [Stella humosa]
MRTLATAAAVAVAMTGLAGGASAQKLEKVEFFLNWVPGGDHAPYYFARKMKRYEAVGIDLDIQPGKGSAVAIQRGAAGASPLVLADMGAALIARGKGAETVAVMNVYANSPQGLYWLKSSGIKSAKDLAGKKIGNPPGDAARVVFPALAKNAGIDPASVTWVNIDANGKLAALKSKAIDATTSFYNIHHIFQRELGDDMGFLAWRDVGVNPYGNSVLVNAKFLAANKKLVADFVGVSQKAFADCVADPKPCVEALVEANGALKFDNEMTNWELVTVLMSDQTSRSVALGWHDDTRMAADYDLAATYFKLDKAFDVKTVYTNEFLDKSIKMTQPKTK